MCSHVFTQFPPWGFALFAPKILASPTIYYLVLRYTDNLYKYFIILDLFRLRACRIIGLFYPDIPTGRCWVMLLLICSKSAGVADHAAGDTGGKPSFGGGPLTDMEST